MLWRSSMYFLCNRKPSWDVTMLVSFHPYSWLCLSFLSAFFFVKLIIVGFFKTKLLELHTFASNYQIKDVFLYLMYTCDTGKNWRGAVSVVPAIHDMHLWAPWAVLERLTSSWFFPFVLSVLKIQWYSTNFLPVCNLV